MYCESFYYFIHNVKKWHFDVHFNEIMSKDWPQHYSSPPSSWFYCSFRPPEGRRSPGRLWPPVGCSARQDSNQFLVPGCGVCGGWWVLSRAHSLALYEWTAGAALFSANSQNWQPVKHGYTSYILHPSWTGIFQFRAHQPVSIGPKVRSNLTSPGPWRAL